MERGTTMSSLGHENKSNSGRNPQPWDREEYKAGYAARFGGSLHLEAAPEQWRQDWQDADTELGESDRQSEHRAAGREEDYRAAGAELYHVGQQARVHDLPFDEIRTRPWKLGWVDADISIGEAATEERSEDISTREPGQAALERLLAIAAGPTGQSRHVADFLLAWWNADECGRFDLTAAWALDDAIAQDLVRVFGLMVGSNAYPDTLGYGKQFEALVRHWRPELGKQG